MRNLTYPQYSKSHRFVAYFLLFIQLCSPLFLSMAAVARAATHEISSFDQQMLETINEMNSFMAPSSDPSTPPCQSLIWFK